MDLNAKIGIINLRVQCVLEQ